MVISAIVSVMEISEPLGGNSLAFKYSAYLVLSLLFSYVIRLAFVCGADNALAKRLNVKAGRLLSDFKVSYKNVRTKTGSHITLALQR